MKPTDRKRFIEIVVGFAELKGKQLSPPALEIYWRSMRDWDVESFAQAAEQLLRTCEFMPTPKNFEDLKRAARPTAGEAFARAVKHAASSGYRDGPLGDPLVDQAVRSLGGYIVIAMCDEDKLPFLERRFAEHYEAIQDAEDVRDAVPQLMTPTRRTLKGPQPIQALLSRDPHDRRSLCLLPLRNAVLRWAEQPRVELLLLPGRLAQAESGMRGKNLTAVELERIADLLRLGVNRQAIAARFSISANRVTHLATELRRSGLEAPTRVRA